MQGKKAFWEAQLTGLKHLPTESGAWGVLLPRPSSKQKSHEADAAEFLEEINPGWLRFDTRDVVDMNRGYGAFWGLWVSFFGTLVLLPLIGALYLRGDLFDRSSLIPLALGIIFFLFFAIWAYRSARAPFAEPMVLSRADRRFHVWAGKKLGWKSWAYDDLVPFTLVSKLVTPSGASTVYMLRLAVLDPATREIKESIAPAPMQRTPQVCGQIWQFIRENMDGAPESLPPVRRRPSIHDKAADLARFDRRFGASIITPDHRIAPGIFAPCFFWFWAVVDYWQMRAMAWIQRSAPRPEPPAALARALAWEGHNPYRFVALTPDEQLAFQGRLPGMRLRWLVAGTLATVLWGGVFLALCVGILSTLWET